MPLDDPLTTGVSWWPRSYLRSQNRASPSGREPPPGLLSHPLLLFFEVWFSGQLLLRGPVELGIQAGVQGPLWSWEPRAPVPSGPESDTLCCKLSSPGGPPEPSLSPSTHPPSPWHPELLAFGFRAPSFPTAFSSGLTTASPSHPGPIIRWQRQKPEQQSPAAL